MSNPAAYIRKLVKADLGVASDSLHRAQARAASPGFNRMAPYGGSDKTLDEIIADYEAWVAQGREALAYLDTVDMHVTRRPTGTQEEIAWPANGR